MFKFAFPLLCAGVVALVQGGSTVSVDAAQPALVSQATPPRSPVSVCYYACEFFLYPTYDACIAGCPEWVNCERECF